MRKTLFLFCLFSFLNGRVEAQLKYLIEDFEGMTEGTSELKSNGVFGFGNVMVQVDQKIHAASPKNAYSGSTCVKVQSLGKGEYGGWGKGSSINVELDATADYFNFYVNYDGQVATKIKIDLQEDDNSDHAYQKEMDDTWWYLHILEVKRGWQLVSIPLNKFKDGNAGGDGTFNVGYKTGKLFSFIMSFPEVDFLKTKHILYFDFISFSKGKLPTGTSIFDPPVPVPDAFCSLGAWSEEGNSANFSNIALAFENNFKPVEKKMGVVHFFQSFAFDGGNNHNHYPSVERINKVIKEGYIPMITLEDHYVNTTAGTKQPNLYSIVEGHFDSFFGYWASQIK
ncbi:MAG: hypothetical protein H0W61_12115, partial [Bacteroidetes bacterium]|nr:hypothetical protein [Bacteroidota bacterium]